MTDFIQLATIALALLSSPAIAASHQNPLEIFSTKQVDRLIAAFASGSIDEAQLATLPEVAGQNIHRLTVMTGRHRIIPNNEGGLFRNARHG